MLLHDDLSSALAMMRPDVCKHFIGGLTPKCGAGHTIRSLVGGPEYGWMARMPCTRQQKTSLPKDPGPDCSDYAEPTAEEVAEDTARFKAEFDKIYAGVCPQCGASLVVKENADMIVKVCRTCPDVYSIGCKSIAEPDD